MIRHIVLIKMKEDKKNLLPELKKKLQGLYPSIPTIRSIEIGDNIIESPVNWDLSFTALFDSKESINFYLDHPEHIAMITYLQKNCEPVSVVSYEIL